ncbi:MAG: hypothetical protein MI867_08235, partial [Pseudomonadales bacterium]|nr:hypothetical protein [Pseudomonadales bacterium]
PEDTLSFIKPISNVIEEIISPIDQPNPFNPKSGYISSANNKPFANPIFSKHCPIMHGRIMYTLKHKIRPCVAI